MKNYGSMSFAALILIAVFAFAVSGYEAHGGLLLLKAVVELLSPFAFIYLVVKLVAWSKT